MGKREGMIVHNELKERRTATQGCNSSRTRQDVVTLTFDVWEARHMFAETTNLSIHIERREWGV